MPNMKRYRLLAKAEIDGAIRMPGYVFSLPEDVRPPHRGVVESHHGAGGIGSGMRDIPLAVEIDEDQEKKQAEMQERHARERADLDGTAARDELAKRQSEEAAALREEVGKRDLQLQQERETADLKARHESEAEGLKQKPPTPINLPPEDNEHDLRKRQDAEAKALEDKQAKEREAFEATHQAPVAEDVPASRPVLTEPEYAQSIADGPVVPLAPSVADRTPPRQTGLGVD